MSDWHPTFIFNQYIKDEKGDEALREFVQLKEVTIEQILGSVKMLRRFRDDYNQGLLKGIENSIVKKRNESEAFDQDAELIELMAKQPSLLWEVLRDALWERTPIQLEPVKYLLSGFLNAIQGRERVKASKVFMPLPKLRFP